MIKCQEDEYIAVRVQDPRIQNEGSWNSYVDFKIFLYTNSKAFTAKTSCVRRRYSEFVWLRKKLQKNAGLVPVPDLPSKSFFFSFNNEDFIEKRRKGLQYFLDRVVHMTVCLSDSQLHLFLQTQLPVSHIQDCVQGLTPYTVTDAILTYASSNVGWAQEQDAYTQEQCPTPVPYESMESPSPHMPSSQCGPPQSLTASGAAAATAGGAGAAVAAAAAAAADVSNPATDSVTVDVHDVKLVELKEDAQSKALALPSDRHVEAIVEVHTDDADLTIFDQEHAVIEGKASEEGYEDVALEAVDHVEGLLTDDGLGEEETVTEQHQVVSVEAIHEETSGKRSLLVKQSKVEMEPLEVSCEDKLNVEPLPQEGSCLSSASDNDGTLSKSSVMPQSLADHESLQDGNETNARMNQNEPVEEHHGDQSQSEEEEEEVVTLFEEESSAQADVDVDEGVCVEKPEQDDATDKVFQSVQNLQSLDLCEEENKLNGVLSNGHTSDSSGMSAIEDSTEEATECMLEKNISANVIESVVSGSDEDRSVHLEDSLEACEPKDQICCDQIEQPYTDLSAQVEATEGDCHGNVSQEQVDDGLINHMEVTP